MDKPGISRREITWRDDGPRALPQIRALPAWADALVLAGLALLLLLGVGSPGFSRSEAVQIGLTQDAGLLVSHPAPLFSASDGEPVTDAVRLAHGSLTRFLAAPGWYLSAGPDAARPVDLAAADTTTGLVPVRPVSQRDLVATRLAPAIAAVLALVVLFLLARRLLGRPAATVAAIGFGVQPLVLSTGRQVGDTALTLLFGLAAVFVAAGIGARLAAAREPTLTAWTALGLWSGLCLAAGPGALPFLLGAAGFALSGLLAGLRRRHQLGQPSGLGRDLGALAVTALGAVVVWVAVSPSLWGWLPGRLAQRHADRPGLIERGLVADPAEGGGALARLAEGPVLALCLLALAGTVTLLLAARSTRSLNLSRRGAVALLAWALATAAWFLAWPSSRPEHLVPLLVVAALMTASLVAWLQNAPIGIGSWMARELPPSRQGPPRRV